MLDSKKLYQGCVHVISPSGKHRLLGQFKNLVQFDALLTLACDDMRSSGVAIHGVVGGREVSGEFTPREAARL